MALVGRGSHVGRKAILAPKCEGTSFSSSRSAERPGFNAIGPGRQLLAYLQAPARGRLIYTYGMNAHFCPFSLFSTPFFTPAPPPHRLPNHVLTCAVL